MAASDGSLAGFDSLDQLLEARLIARSHCSSREGGGGSRSLRAHLTSATPSSAPSKKTHTKQQYVPEDKLVEVRRVLYGLNQGAPVRELPLPTITGLILGEIGRLVKEPPDRKAQRKIPLFTTVHRKHLMIEE